MFTTFHFWRCRIGACVVVACLLNGLGCHPSRRDPAGPASDTAKSNRPYTSQQLKAHDTSASEVRFFLIPSAHTGIDLIHRFPDEAPVSLIADQCSGAGVCVGDFDGDDWPDVYFTNYDRGNRLYRNLGNFRFQDVTRQAGVAAKGSWCGGACFADVDNDSDLDLYVCVFDGPNRLYINHGEGVFRDEAADRGVSYSGASVSMAFADYDLDGDLDGYLVTHRMNVGEEYRLPTSSEDAFSRGIIQTDGRGGVQVTDRYRELFQLMDRGEGRIELVIAGQADRLYQNDGKGRFRVVNVSAGIHGFDIGLAAIWWDYNNDGRPDLYVSNDYKGADQLYRNEGSGHFTDVTRQALPHIPWFSMGSAVADIDNDGRLDLLASDMSGTDHYQQKMSMGDMQKELWFLRRADPPQYMRNSLFLNTGTARFLEVAHLAGVTNTDWTWSPLLGDLDNDGWVDLFVSNGMSRDFMNSDLATRIESKQSEQWREHDVLRQRNLAFRNNGDLAFQSVGQHWGLDTLSASYGAATADLDRDGDLDLVVTNFGEAVSVFRNHTSSGASLLIRLVGRTSNRFGFGARVDVETDQHNLTRYLSPSQGFMSSGEPMLHFGLGDTKRPVRIVVAWPSGARQELRDVDVNQLLTIKESEPSPSQASRASGAMFMPLPDYGDIVHRESDFDDFKQQPLLPSKLSQLGPGLAVADVNGDGTDDVFLSPAAGAAPQLLMRSAGGQSVRQLDHRYNYEGLGAVFFDYDADGDEDLYCVSGGVETPADDPALRDRLYRNDGTGNLTDLNDDTLPDIADSGSVVCAADYDRDGDLDLFVGGLVVPAAYPTAPPSRLLRNDGGRFSLASDPFGARQRNPIVTGALWTDADQDGWVDLFVTQQWGPVLFFRNEQGVLKDSTESMDLDARTGWWNGITGADLDGDGDIDYVVSNVGLNTKYHASPDHPALLFYGDLDGSGQPRLVEANFERGILYPARGRSCTTQAMPTLGQRFPTFHEFAIASLEDVYSADRLTNALRLEANTLASGILINHLDRFEFRELPRLAQVAPSYGSALTDVDGNGTVDLYLVQNSFSPQPETGHMDGGLSLLLRGQGDGTFTPVGPEQSGLIVPGDAKSLVTIDLNQDDRPDFLVGVNDAAVQAFLNQAGTPEDFMSIQLVGPRGNTHAVGAHVLVEFADGSRQGAESYAGSGYLSQSQPRLFFGRGGRPISRIIIRWPDGNTTTHVPPPDVRRIQIQSHAPPH